MFLSIYLKNCMCISLKLFWVNFMVIKLMHFRINVNNFIFVIYKDEYLIVKWLKTFWHLTDRLFCILGVALNNFAISNFKLKIVEYFPAVIDIFFILILLILSKNCFLMTKY